MEGAAICLTEFRMMQVTEGCSSGKRAIGLKPDWADAYYNLGCVYALKNDKKNAISSLENAIRLDNRLRKEIKTDADLNNLRGDEDFRKLLK